jgi:hypothetical protein
MAGRSRPIRLAQVAAVLLALNAVLMGTLWILTRRPYLLVGTGLALILAPLVFALARRAERRWAEVDAARRDAQGELRALQRALRPRDS